MRKSLAPFRVQTTRLTIEPSAAVHTAHAAVRSVNLAPYLYAFLAQNVRYGAHGKIPFCAGVEPSLLLVRAGRRATELASGAHANDSIGQQRRHHLCGFLAKNGGCGAHLKNPLWAGGGTVQIFVRSGRQSTALAVGGHASSPTGPSCTPSRLRGHRSAGSPLGAMPIARRPTYCRATLPWLRGSREGAGAGDRPFSRGSGRPWCPATWALRVPELAAPVR